LHLASHWLLAFAQRRALMAAAAPSVVRCIPACLRRWQTMLLQPARRRRRGTMLSNDQIDHFRTFGFVDLPDLLGTARAEALRAEADVAIRDAYAATYDQRVIDGISGHYLPMTS
jgi:hypothetical protein